TKWQLVGPSTPNFTVSANPADVQNLTPGQVVQLSPSYDAVNFTDGNGALVNVINPGNVVRDGSALYRYVGSSARIFDLTGPSDNNSIDPSPNFSDTSTWQRIAGTSGAFYQYVGPAGAVDLNSQDYTNTNLWSLLPSSSVSVSAQEGATINAEAASAA